MFFLWNYGKMYKDWIGFGGGIMDDKMNYYLIFREEWYGFYYDGKVLLIEVELDNIKSVND